MQPNTPRKQTTIAMALWVAATVMALAHFAWLCLVGAGSGVESVIQQGPLSNLHVTLMSVGVSWILLGALVFLLWRGRVHAGNAPAVAGFFAVSLLYVNVLRERSQYGDIQDYVLAAVNLHLKEPLHSRYLYPPFWAAVLEPLLAFGPRAIFGAAWLLNLASLFGMYFLLQAVLRKYGFASGLATLVTFAFMVVNVPILRTLGYVQVNLHVTNLILLSLLFYPRSPLLSALALSLAVQFKVSPLVLVLLFALEKDYRWLLWFGVSTLLATGATVLVHGWSPYRDFLTNIGNAYSASGIAYRETSIDSWFRALASLWGRGDRWIQFPIWAVKGILVALAFKVGLECVKRRCFHPEEERGRIVFNAIPVLLIVMMMVSPLVWEHHAVFVALSYLLVLKGLSSAGDGLVFGFAYFLEFLMPTLDFFPWSYGRLLSPILWLLLVGALAKGSWPSRIFLKANQRLDEM